MGIRLGTPARAYRYVRDQLGSVRGVYLGRDNVVPRGDFSEGREIVLLLHGFFQTRNVWEVMEDRLRYDGYAVMSFRLAPLFYRFNTQPVDQLARTVAEKMESLAERHAFDRFHIVGHSKGGLVARRYVQQYGGARRVKSVITLGTPHHGTPTALLGMGVAAALPTRRTSARDLLPWSPVVRAVNRDSFPASIPLTSVYSKADHVCPYWSSVLRPRPGETSLANVEVPGVGHSALTWNANVYRVVRDRLDAAVALWRVREGRDDPSALRAASK